MNDLLKERKENFEKMAREELGLDFYPINYEIVPIEVLLEVMSYALPTRSRHWSYGQSYEYQKITGEMGHSKVYEIVLNNDPSYAFLLDTNSDIANTMVMAHVIGHCLAGDTKIETTNGFVEIKDIKPGDKVLTHNGTYHNVVESKLTKHTKEIVEVWVKGEEQPLRCTPEHRLLVWRDGLKFWCQAKYITSNDLIATPKTKYRGTLEEIIVPIEASQPTPIWKKELFEEVGGYRVPLDYNFGRIIGLYIAEGSRNNTSCSFALHKDETEYANFIVDWFDKIGINASTLESKDSRSIRVMVYDKSFAIFFEENCGKYSEGKVIPEFAINNSVSKEFIAGIVRGCFEGDGYIHGNKHCSSFTTTSETLAYQLKSLIRTFGIKPGIRSRNRDGRKTAYDFHISGPSHRNLLEVCCIDFDIDINREWSFSKDEDDYLMSKIDNIREVELLEEIGVYDIEVEEAHSFVTLNGIVAHNCHFFKHNYLFQKTDRKMVYHAAERASRIDEYIKMHGLSRVEKIMDIAFALDKQIDWHKGIHRERYPKKKKIYVNKKKGEYDDILGNDKEFSLQKKIINETIPPHPEYDLLWFLVNYAELEDWEQDVFQIIREESFYFYPQHQTKIMNEGFASFVHAELMYLSDNISEKEHMDFARIHERVVQPGRNKLNINPYFLGFAILTDIRKRWDKLHEEGKSDITGMQKILEVVKEENDVSFLRNYLTKELVEEIDLSVYKRFYDAKRDEYLEIESQKVDDVIQVLVEDINTYAGSPVVCITKATADDLELEHTTTDIGTLDVGHLEKVMEYLYQIWGTPVNLKSVDNAGKEIHYTYDEEGLSDPSDEDPTLDLFDT